MICVFFEGSQYVELFEKRLGCNFEINVQATPYGKQQVLVPAGRNDLICITEAGHGTGLTDSQVPKSVAYILQQYNVDGMLMVSKVGGINSLLNVGDILVMSDYIDRTSIYDFSYMRDILGCIPRYDMQEPFNIPWRTECYRTLKNNGLYAGRNIFCKGVYICTNGPGFESKAEIASYDTMKCDVVGHYLSPYTYYCRELGIAYLTVSIVSNKYDCDELLIDTDETKNVMVGIVTDAIESFKPHFREEQKKHWIRNLS